VDFARRSSREGLACQLLMHERRWCYFRQKSCDLEAATQHMTARTCDYYEMHSSRVVMPATQHVLGIFERDASGYLRLRSIDGRFPTCTARVHIVHRWIRVVKLTEPPDNGTTWGINRNPSDRWWLFGYLQRALCSGVLFNDEDICDFRSPRRTVRTVLGRC